MVALPPTLHGGLPKPSLQAPSHSAATPPGSAGRDAGTLHLANGDDAEGDPLVGADDTGPSSDSAHGDVTESLRSYARDRIANTASLLRQGRRTAGVMRRTSPISVRRPRVGGAAGPGEAAWWSCSRVAAEGRAGAGEEFHGDWNYTIRPTAPINVSFIE